ncbi:hypothetical protein C2I36_04610 [Rhodobacteraceae bacterium WD3A24]|nr:hypothetical protein C2I36_04610 [Rhodobacteraceae bacterium WD3A24]
MCIFGFEATGKDSDVTERSTNLARHAAFLRAIPLVAIVATATTGAILLHDMMTFETLRENRAALLEFRDANYLLTAAAFLAIYVVIVSLSLPGATLASLTGGFLFGLMPGALFNVAAATTGAAGIFLAAYWGLGDRLAARIDASDGRVRRIREGLRVNQVPVLLLMRLAPMVPFFVANLIPAFMGVRLRVFVATTAIGILPGTVIYTWVGAGMGEVFARGERPDLGIIFDPYILGPILGAAALAALPLGIRAWRGRLI